MMVFLSFLIIWTTLNTQRWLGPGVCNCSHALSPICPSATEQGAFVAVMLCLLRGVRRGWINLSVCLTPKGAHRSHEISRLWVATATT